MNVRKRPVYLVVKPLGVTPEGEEIVTIIEIKQTHFAAEQLSATIPGSKVKKEFIIPS